MLKSFFRYSLILFVGYGVFSSLLVFVKDYQKGEISALLLAGILALINIVFVVFFLVKKLGRPEKEFVSSFWRITLMRMVIILAIFFTILTKITLNHFVFTVAFFILYFLFQMIEIYILHTAKLFR